MTHQQKIDSQLILQKLYDMHGYELIDWIASKVLCEASEQEVNNNELLSASLKVTGRRLQAEYHNLQAAQLINSHLSSKDDV